VDDAGQALEALVEGVRGRSGEPTFERRLDDFLSLARAGEGGVAVEALCSNLYEFDVTLDGDEHSRLVELASHWGAGGSTADELDRLKP
jgi:hypothetical protein